MPDFGLNATYFAGQNRVYSHKLLEGKWRVCVDYIVAYEV